MLKQGNSLSNPSQTLVLSSISLQKWRLKYLSLNLRYIVRRAGSMKRKKNCWWQENRSMRHCLALQKNMPSNVPCLKYLEVRYWILLWMKGYRSTAETGLVRNTIFHALTATAALTGYTKERTRSIDS